MNATFTVPAKFTPRLRAAIALEVAAIGRDVKRELRGELTSTRPALIDATLTGQCIVQIGVADPDAQTADLEWPAEQEQPA